MLNFKLKCQKLFNFMRIICFFVCFFFHCRYSLCILRIGLGFVLGSEYVVRNANRGAIKIKAKVNANFYEGGLRRFLFFLLEYDEQNVIIY